MDQPANTTPAHGVDDRNRAARVARFEPGAIRRVDDARDMHDRVGVAHQRIECGRILERPRHPFQPCARRLRPARQRVDAQRVDDASTRRRVSASIRRRVDASAHLRLTFC